MSQMTVLLDVEQVDQVIKMINSEIHVAKGREFDGEIDPDEYRQDFIKLSQLHSKFLEALKRS